MGNGERCSRRYYRMDVATGRQVGVLLVGEQAQQRKDAVWESVKDFFKRIFEDYQNTRQGGVEIVSYQDSPTPEHPNPPIHFQVTLKVLAMCVEGSNRPILSAAFPASESWNPALEKAKEDLEAKLAEAHRAYESQFQSAV